MRKITNKEVQVIEEYDDCTEVDQVVISGIRYKDMAKHGYTRVKDKKTGKYFFRFNIDNRTNQSVQRKNGRADVLRSSSGSSHADRSPGMPG